MRIVILSSIAVLTLAISLSSYNIQKSTNKGVKNSGAIVIEARVKHLSEPEYKTMKHDRAAWEKNGKRYPVKQ